ncbi:DUF5615 family PIN-like protein [Ekhidna sp.]|uniref:DUF5615 family PIN-like protein n=1 Tax=Ekhidna sp. TaxID=2608089 RepID=UPI003CCBEC78
MLTSRFRIHTGLHEGWASLFQRLTYLTLEILSERKCSIASVNHLKSKGFDITSIGVDDSGISDEYVMKTAMEQDRTIITYDSDYGELIFKHGFKPNAGIIFIRQQPADPLETAKIVDRLTSNSNLSFERTLTVVDSNSLRQKKY